MCLMACYVSFTILTINFIFMISAQDETSLSSEKEKYVLPLLGYIHGYKIGQNIALSLPPLILSPIVIVPIMNEHQEIQIRKSAAGETDQEIGVDFQDDVPSKIIQTDSNHTMDEDLELAEKEDYNTEVYNNNSSSEEDIFKQLSSNETNSNGSEGISGSNGNLDTTQSSEEINEVNITKVENTTTKPSGPYPNAIYNNSDVNKLSITVTPLQNNLTVPNTENKWQNFSLSSQNRTENITKETDFNESNSTLNDIIYFPTTSSTIDRYNLYPPRRYYQNIDSLSITTNSYTNVEHHLPPAYDDRWQRFSSLEKSYLTSGFRPLAGLYYDGFLHKPLDKQVGFRPNQQYNHYNYV